MSAPRATGNRAHNASIAADYLANESLAAEEGRVERFFINVVWYGCCSRTRWWQNPDLRWAGWRRLATLQMIRESA
jgi:hypothetical protein